MGSLDLEDLATSQLPPSKHHAVVNNLPVIRARNSFLARHAVWRVDCQRESLTLAEERRA
jgi:hypothetical protein